MRKLVTLMVVAAGLTVPAATGMSAASAAVVKPSVWPCTLSTCFPGDIFGYVEASPSLSVRTAPCASSECAIVSQLPYGTRVAIDCYERGDTVTGWGGTTNEWDLVDDGGEGFLGWVSDAWINTGGDTATMVREC